MHQRKMEEKRYDRNSIRHTYSYWKSIWFLIIMTVVSAVILPVAICAELAENFEFFMIFAVIPATVGWLISLFRFIRMRIAPEDYVMLEGDCFLSDIVFRKSSAYLSTIIIFKDESGESHSFRVIVRTTRMWIRPRISSEVKVTVGYDAKRNRYLVEESVRDLFLNN